MIWTLENPLVVAAVGFVILSTIALIFIKVYNEHLYQKRMASYLVDPYKLYCIVSLEAIKLMGGNRGKMIAQGGHAFVHAFKDSADNFVEHAAGYLESGNAYKITLQVKTTAELVELEALYKGRFGTALITDAARTVFNEPTTTCLGIGPIRESQRETILKNLTPFK